MQLTRLHVPHAHAAVVGGRHRAPVVGCQDNVEGLIRMRLGIDGQEGPLGQAAPVAAVLRPGRAGQARQQRSPQNKI